MAKDLEEALVNIENKLGGSPQEHMDLGEHLDYIEELLDEGGGGTGSGITDVQINGSSVVSDKVADIELKRKSYSRAYDFYMQILEYDKNNLG